MAKRRDGYTAAEDARMDPALGAYEWRSIAALWPGGVEHAVVEFDDGHVLQTLCRIGGWQPHEPTRDRPAVAARCGNCIWAIERKVLA